MNESIIAVRYAKALMSIGLEKKTLDALERDILTISGLVSELEDFGLLLKSPVVRASRKIKAIRQIFSGHIHDDSLRFLELLITNRREALLPDVARSFLRMARAHRGIKTAQITTAIPLSEQILEQIGKAVEELCHTRVELQASQNPSIIGGFVLQVGDDRYDASIASGLERMKKELTQRNTK